LSLPSQAVVKEKQGRLVLFSSGTTPRKVKREQQQQQQISSTD
jgi:hypothetical protein